MSVFNDFLLKIMKFAVSKMHILRLDICFFFESAGFINVHSKMVQNIKKIHLEKSQYPPLSSFVQDTRTSGLKGENLGRFLIAILTIGDVFGMFPQKHAKNELLHK